MPTLKDGKDYQICHVLAKCVNSKLKEFEYENRDKPDKKKRRMQVDNTGDLSSHRSRRILEKGENRILIDIVSLKLVNITVGQDVQEEEKFLAFDKKVDAAGRNTDDDDNDSSDDNDKREQGENEADDGGDDGNDNGKRVQEEKTANDSNGDDDNNEQEQKEREPNHSDDNKGAGAKRICYQRSW